MRNNPMRKPPSILCAFHLKRNAIASQTEKGQALILIAVAFVGLLAFIGLAIDFGILLIGMGHLQRAVDSAALAAAIQYRSGIQSPQITDAANEFLRFNNVDLDNISSSIQTCDTNPTDPSLCTNPPHKLVRVIARANVRFVFLTILGINNATISASSVGEAASMDVVLVIDISESMTYNASAGPPMDPMRDPAACNPINQCEPFKDVKNAAKSFADQILNKPVAQEDNRLAIVVFSNGWEVGPYGTQVISPCDPAGAYYGGISCSTNMSDPTYMGWTGWMNSRTQANAVIDKLQVYTPPRCDDPSFTGRPGSCRNYDSSGTFTGMSCPWAWSIALLGYNDYSTCTTTNIGGGLKLAGQQFDNDRRTDSLWIVILLTDGAANATALKSTDNEGAGPGVLANPINFTVMRNSLPIGYCPEHQYGQFPSCRDNSVISRHSPTTDPLYDADDFARDEANYVGCDPTSPAAGCNGIHGQGAVMFSIGLGKEVLTRSAGDTPPLPYGDSLLRFVGAVGDDGDPSSDPCSTVSVPPVNNPYYYTCGNYYFAQFSAQLTGVFNNIFSRIYTRLAQ